MFQWSCLWIAKEWEELLAPVRGRKQVHVFVVTDKLGLVLLQSSRRFLR